MNILYQSKNQEENICSSYQYILPNYNESDFVKKQIQELKLIIPNVTNDECLNALKFTKYNIHEAVLFLLEKDKTNENNLNIKQKEKIKISSKIWKEFGGKLNFFEIAQVLIISNNNEEEAINILRTMI